MKDNKLFDDLAEIAKSLKRWHDESRADSAAQICNELHPIIVKAETVLKQINGG